MGDRDLEAACGVRRPGGKSERDKTLRQASGWSVDVRLAVDVQCRACGTHDIAPAVLSVQAKCQELDEARNFCASLLQTTFAGGGIGDARENQLEVGEEVQRVVMVARLR